jgi:hypothetical protein
MLNQKRQNLRDSILCSAESTKRVAHSNLCSAGAEVKTDPTTYVLLGQEPVLALTQHRTFC